MTDNGATSRGLPPHAQLIQMGTASWVSGVVHAAAKLGIADRLAEAPRSAAELAGTMRMHARDVDGVLRPGVLARLGRDRLFTGNGKDGI